MNQPRKIYLDHNATTPVDSRVLNAMLPYFTEMYGNASSINHAYGWDAEEAVNTAREQVAKLMSTKPSSIYFTSGATEAINIGLLGYCDANKEKGNHIITCQTEHRAVLDTCAALEKLGFKITYLETDRSGNIDLKSLQKALNPETILVCLMHANNETGVIHPLQKIAAILKNHQAALMTDATQTLGKIPFDVDRLGVDIATFSAHKLYGPKGVGALYVRPNFQDKIQSIQFGGGQEKGLRPGTLNVPGIVGFGMACEICGKAMRKEATRLKKLRDSMERELRRINGLTVNGGSANRLPHVSNVTIPNIDGSRLIRSLKNLAVSQGSACTSGTVEPSHVLRSMGVSEELALSSLRIGLGRLTMPDDIETAIEDIDEVVNNLRIHSK